MVSWVVCLGRAGGGYGVLVDGVQSSAVVLRISSGSKRWRLYNANRRFRVFRANWVPVRQHAGDAPGSGAPVLCAKAAGTQGKSIPSFIKHVARLIREARSAVGIHRHAGMKQVYPDPPSLKLPARFVRLLL